MAAARGAGIGGVAWRVVDPCLLCIASLVVYGLLAQETFYGVDGWSDLRRVGTGDSRSDMHLLYKPGLAYAWSWLSQLGCSLYESAVWFSAIGTAVGVGLCHAATIRLGVDRRASWVVGLLVATAPGIVFFGTVVERHGPFFAYAGLCMLATAHFIRCPSAPRAVLLAASCALAYAAHSTGIVLLALLVPLALAEAARRDAGEAPAREAPSREAPGRAAWPGRRLLGLGVLVVFVTVAGVVLARQVAVWVGQSETATRNLAFLLEHAGHHIADPLGAGVNFWQEWLYPFLPVSVLWVLVLRKPEQRLVGAAFATGLVAFCGLAFLILGRFEERGAYLLPLAWPAAWLTVRAVPRPVALVALALAVGLAITQVFRHDDRHLDPVAEGYRELRGDGEIYHLVAELRDFELLFLYRPDLFPYPPPPPLERDYWDLIDVCGIDAALLPDLLPLADGLLDQKIAAGREILIPAATWRFVQEPPHWIEERRTGPLLAQHLSERFRFEPANAVGFEGFRLVPR